MDSFLKSQETVMQTLSRLGDQMSQLANPVSEIQQGTLPSQPLPNPRNTRQANEAQDTNQCNLVHILRSEKVVDNHQVMMPQDSTQPSTTSSSILLARMNPKKINQLKRCTHPKPHTQIGLSVTIVHKWSKS